MASVNDAQAQNIKFASISAAAATNSIVAAAAAAGSAPARKIRVLSAFLSSVDAKTVQFTDAVGGTGLTGAVPCAVNGGFVLPFNPAGWFETTAGNALGLSLGAATGVAGSLSYALV
jgi:hypothetical protein